MNRPDSNHVAQDTQATGRVMDPRCVDTAYFVLANLEVLKQKFLKTNKCSAATRLET